jgi:hypothetical protein
MEMDFNMSLSHPNTPPEVQLQVQHLLSHLNTSLEENSRLKHTLSLHNPSPRTTPPPDPGKKFEHGMTCNPLDASMQQWVRGLNALVADLLYQASLNGNDLVLQSMGVSHRAAHLIIQNPTRWKQLQLYVDAIPLVKSIFSEAVICELLSNELDRQTLVKSLTKSLPIEFASIK